MGRILHRIVAVIVLMLLPSLAFASKPPDDIQKAKIMSNTYRMQIPFLENRGQIENEDLEFYAKTFGGTVFVEKNGTLTYNLPVKDKGGVVIKEIFTDKKIKAEGLYLSPTKAKYFIGNGKSNWKTKECQAKISQLK